MSPLSDHPRLGRQRGGVFYLHGEDEFRKEELVRELIERHLDPGTRDFNLDPLRGTDVDAETLASVLGTPPMMAEWRVVVVREVEALAGSPRARDALLSVARTPPPGLALILSCTVPQGSKAKFYGDLAKAATSLELRAMPAAEVPGWLIARARERHGVELDVDAARALGSAIGAHLGILEQELDKLASLVGAGGRVGLEEVRAAGTSLPAQDRWAWIDLVSERRWEEALRGLEILFAQGESAVALAIALTTQLLRIGVVASGGPRALEAELSGNASWILRKVVPQARHWTPEEVQVALEGLLRMDRLLKASPLPPEHLMEEWLLGLMARRAA